MCKLFPKKRQFLFFWFCAFTKELEITGLRLQVWDCKLEITTKCAVSIFIQTELRMNTLPRNWCRYQYSWCSYRSVSYILIIAIVDHWVLKYFCTSGITFVSLKQPIYRFLPLIFFYHWYTSVWVAIKEIICWSLYFNHKSTYCRQMQYRSVNCAHAKDIHLQLSQHQ